MTRLQELGLRFIEEGDLKPALSDILDAAVTISCADFGNIQLLDPKTGDLKIVAHHGLSQWWLDYWDTVSKGRGSWGNALAQKKRVIVEDVEHSPIFAGTPFLDIQRKAGIRAFHSIPLVSRSGEPLGMFSMHYTKPHRPDEQQLKLLDILAKNASEIIVRTRFEEALRESERQLQHLIQFAPTAIYEIDFRGPRLARVNDATCILSGYSREELLSMNPMDLLDAESKVRFQERLAKMAQGQPIDPNVDFTIFKKDGSMISVVLNTKPMYS